MSSGAAMDSSSLSDESTLGGGATLFLAVLLNLVLLKLTAGGSGCVVGAGAEEGMGVPITVLGCVSLLNSYF